MKSFFVRFLALVLVFALLAPGLEGALAQRPSRDNTASPSETATATTEADEPDERPSRGNTATSSETPTPTDSESDEPGERPSRANTVTPSKTATPTDSETAAPTQEEAESETSAEGNTSAALVSGSYRIVIHQTAIVTDPSSIGVPGNQPVVAAIADVTNLGASGPFDPTIVSVGTFNDSPLEMVEGVPADAEMSSEATIKAGLSLEGNFTIVENSSIRLVLVFPLADTNQDSKLGVRVAEQVASVENTMVSELDNGAAPEFKADMELRVADVTDVPGRGKLLVVFRDGGAEEITIAGIHTPERGSSRLPGCYYNESAAAIPAMTGGTVWLEEDDDGYLVWINNPVEGTFDLLQWRIVQEGYGGSNNSDRSSYTSWLASTTDWAQSEGTGMWTDCTTALGEWKVQPTVAPEPTKTLEQERAEARQGYKTISLTTFANYPNIHSGEKIIVTGMVFQIVPMQDGYLYLIALDTPNHEPAVVFSGAELPNVYEGSWIRVYGVGDGTFSAPNRAGQINTYPAIKLYVFDTEP